MISIVKRALVLAFLAGSATCAQAALLDILPGDYVALRSGERGVTGYLYQRNSAGPYTSGTRTGNAGVSVDAAALRVSGFHDVAGMIWAWSVTPLWSTAKLAEGTMPSAFGRDAGGSGDVRLSATLWPVADVQRGEYVGLTVAWFEPTGNYSNQRVLNIGENRRKLALLAGWSTPVTKNLRLEIIPELAIYGANSDYLGGRRRTQDNTLALTSYLRWRMATQWEVHVGAQVNGGGETSINNVPQNDVARNTRLMLGLAHALDRNTVVSIRYGADTRIGNGFRLDREWQFRIGRKF